MPIREEPKLTWVGWVLLVATCGLAYPILALFKPRRPRRPRVGVYPRSKNFMR